MVVTGFGRSGGEVGGGGGGAGGGGGGVLFFFNDTATTEIYTLSLHDALPIWVGRTKSSYGAALWRQRNGLQYLSRAASLRSTTG